MRTYLRNRTLGGTYFFTVNLAERHGNRLLVANIEALSAAFRQTRIERPFSMPAWVVLPEHLHCVWRLPPGDDDYPTRWRLIKSRFARAIPKGEHRNASRIAKAERGIWHRRYWEHLIRDEGDLHAHIDYIHANPMKHGHVERVRDWPHSSFHGYVAKWMLPSDWAGEVPNPMRDAKGEAS